MPQPSGICSCTTAWPISLINTIEALGDRHDLCALGTLAPQPQGMLAGAAEGNTELLGRARAVAPHSSPAAETCITTPGIAAPARADQCPVLPPFGGACVPAAAAPWQLGQAGKGCRDSLDNLYRRLTACSKTAPPRACPTNDYFSIATQAISVRAGYRRPATGPAAGAWGAGVSSSAHLMVAQSGP